MTPIVETFGQLTFTIKEIRGEKHAAVAGEPSKDYISEGEFSKASGLIYCLTQSTGTTMLAEYLNGSLT